MGIFRFLYCWYNSIISRHGNDILNIIFDISAKVPESITNLATETATRDALIKAILTEARDMDPNIVIEIIHTASTTPVA